MILNPFDLRASRVVHTRAVSNARPVVNDGHAVRGSLGTGTYLIREGGIVLDVRNTDDRTAIACTMVDGDRA